MKILLISQWFDPEPTFKGLQFARELTEQGHQVHVVTGFPNYPGGKIYDGYRVRLYQREVIDGIHVLRVPLYPSHDGSKLRRIWNYLSFALSASVGVLASTRPDVAYVYHPPATVALPASVLKLVKGVPFVYDVQDLWPDTLSATDMVRNPRILRFVGSAMRRIYSGASRIVVLSPGFKERLVAIGVPAGKIAVIPNWADENRIHVPASPTAEDDDRPFTITFAGNMGTAQALHTVLAAAEHLSDDNVRFVFVGDGLVHDDLVADAERRGLQNVSFIPRVPITEIGQHFRDADALLVHLRDDPLFRITIPSKIQAYLLAGKPILMGVSGDAATLLAETGAGVSFAPEDPVAMSEAVRALAGMTREDRHAMGVAGSRYYDTHLSLRIGTERFSQELRAAIRSQPHFELLKRILDFTFSSLMLCVLVVPMGLIALAVRIRLGGPVIFSQVRPGRNGVPFTMRKFRSMTDECDHEGELLSDSRRLGSFGRFLRMSSLDELPGLFNVLRGDMSIVGPRPLLERYSPYYSFSERTRLEVRPGITGWAQVNGRNAASWDSRLSMDAWYVEKRSFRVDAKILALTVLRVFQRRDVHAAPSTMMLDFDDERRGRNQSDSQHQTT